MTDTPGGTVAHLNDLFDAGRLEDLVDLYEDGATFVPEPGRVVSGREAIRAEFARMLARRPRLSYRIERVLQAGDTALVACRWQLETTRRDGTLRHTGGLSSDVLRRRPDGSWGLVIDDPFGAGAEVP